jgi:hypothetical protein
MRIYTPKEIDQLIKDEAEEKGLTVSQIASIHLAVVYNIQLPPVSRSAKENNTNDKN